MSQFVKSHAELSALRRGDRISGFTEAELEAAEWSRNLVESRQNMARPTNSEARTFTSSAEARSKVVQAQYQDACDASKAAKKKEMGDRSTENRTKEKKLKKERKGKVRKEKKTVKNPEKHLEKGARKLAKEMRKEEKARRKHAKHDSVSLAQVDSISGMKEETTCSLIDDLIEAARQQVDSTLKISVAPAGSTDNVDSSGGGASLSQVTPRDPINPLVEAHDLEAYRKFQENCSKQRGGEENDELDWNHLPYLYRSPSPCRLRTHGPMWPTRRGAWKSRAGGAYLPPTADGVTEGAKGSSKGSAARRGFDSPIRSPSPARYMYPDEFKDKYVVPQRRRSPSYNPEPRSPGSESSVHERLVPKSRSRSRRSKRHSHKLSQESLALEARKKRDES